VRNPYAPVRWGAGGEWGVFSLPLVLARRAVNFMKFIRTVAEHVSFLRRNRIALVHQNNSITRHREWMCAAFLAGVPCVASERGLNSKYTRLDRIYAWSLALIIPMSHWIMDHMVERGVPPTNIRVMYDGLDPSSIKVARSTEMLREVYRVQPNQPVLGIVGNIREWKGQETVIRALIEVVKVHPDVVCFFVGAAAAVDKAYADRLNSLIEEAGIKDNIRFTGYQQDPASFVNMMKLVIHASVLPEPFGMVVLEAMAQRKAVIGSRAGGVIEMVVEGVTGYTFPPGDSTTLSARIIELLDKPDRAVQMGQAGYERLISSFTLQRYMDEIHAAYREILGKRPIPSSIGLSATVKAYD
jgi:glycosyltransferase involved in cell wall biosynthesis